MGGILQWMRSWLQREQGATAVEFALVGAPLSLMIIGLIETSIMFAASSMLQDATMSASRLIRTGQLQQMASGDPQQVFEDEMCNQIVRLINCGNIKYEVIKVDSFASVGTYQPNFDNNGDLIPAGFDIGGVNDVILVRSIYNYPLMTPVISGFLSNHVGNTRQMMASVVLQTEPYIAN